MKNYYEILGVSKSAGEEEIRARYFELAKKYHPDVNKESDAGKIFKDVNEAYATLSDSLRRADYDQKLEGAFMRQKEEAPRTEEGAPTQEEVHPPTTAQIVAAFGRMIFVAGVGFLAGGLLEFLLWYFVDKSPFVVSALYPGIAWGTVAGLFWGADLNFNVESFLGPGYMGRTYTFMRTTLYALSFAYLGGRLFTAGELIIETNLFPYIGMTIGLLVGATIGSQGEGVFELQDKKGRFTLLYTSLRALEVGLIGLVLAGMLGFVMQTLAGVNITITAAFLGFLLGTIVGAISPPNLNAYASYASAAVKNIMIVLLVAGGILLGIIFSYIFHDQLQQFIAGTIGTIF